MRTRTRFLAVTVILAFVSTAITGGLAGTVGYLLEIPSHELLLLVANTTASTLAAIAPLAQLAAQIMMRPDDPDSPGN